MWYWIIYSSFSTQNKPWLVTRWQTWHVQSPETCSFDFIGLLGVWLFSWSCICYLRLSPNASASLPELVTGRISKIRHPQMLGYQKWIPMMWKYFRSFHYGGRGGNTAFSQVESLLLHLQCLVRPCSFLRAAGAVSEPGSRPKLSWEVAGYQQRPGVGLLLHNNLSAWKEIAGFIGISSSVANEDRAAWSVEVLSNHNSHLLQHFFRSDPQGYLLLGISQLWSTSAFPLGSKGPSQSLLALTSHNQHGSQSQTVMQLFLVYQIHLENKDTVFAVIEMPLSSCLMHFSLQA